MPVVGLPRIVSVSGGKARVTHIDADKICSLCRYPLVTGKTRKWGKQSFCGDECLDAFKNGLQEQTGMKVI